MPALQRLALVISQGGFQEDQKRYGMIDPRPLNVQLRQYINLNAPKELADDELDQLVDISIVAARQLAKGPFELADHVLVALWAAEPKPDCIMDLARIPEAESFS